MLVSFRGLLVWVLLFPIAWIQSHILVPSLYYNSWNVRPPTTSTFRRGSQSHDAATKVLSVSTIQRKLPKQISWDRVDNSFLRSLGVYYGFNPRTLQRATDWKRPRVVPMSESVQETLSELKLVRKEMEHIRKELQTLQRALGVSPTETRGDSTRSGEVPKVIDRQRRALEADLLASEIEEWAENVFNETEEDGWVEFPCMRRMQSSLNPTGRTKVHLKWMRDSRGDKADPLDDRDYPCCRLEATLDAPLDVVCAYLSQESVFPQYNDVIDFHKDVEEISPQAKICWNQSPQILFISPRDFVTFCYHRWRKDGTGVIVNQAVDHPQYPPNQKDEVGRPSRAYALRGANFISKSPDDPNKTIVRVVAHGSPGVGVPQWAARAAIHSLTAIEPYKLLHRINDGIQSMLPQLERKKSQLTEHGSKPIGIAQLGYSCYWPAAPVPNEELLTNGTITENIATPTVGDLGPSGESGETE